VTPKARRQTYMLGALVVVLAVVLYLRLPVNSDPDVAPQAETATQSSNQASRGAARQEMPVTDVRLEALKHDDAPLAGSERNPFRFRPKAPPPEPPRVAAPPPQVFVPPPALGPPPPPPIPLRYIGLLGAASQPDRVAVLSDARGNPFYGKEGDIIDGRYRVLRIAADSVDVAYADGRGRQTFRLSSQ
jgi:hypothetical protein